MSRKWSLRLLVFFLVWCLQWVHYTQAQTATPTPSPFVAEETFGRLIEDAEVRTNPRGTELGTYEQGSELIIKSTNPDATWYEVEMLVDGESGWVQTDNVELALVGSTGTYREYAGGLCIATPTVARRMPNAGLFDRYQHELKFADQVVIDELDEFYLIFNQEVRDMAYRIDDVNNAIVLPASWVIVHSGLDPRWDNEGAWGVEWDCTEDSPLPDPNVEG